jgi:hypothetical protein
MECFMKNKISLVGMLSMTLALGLVFSGCTSMFDALGGQKEVETETSKKLKSTANDLIIARANGMEPNVFKAAFEQKLPGLKMPSSIHFGGGAGNTVDFTYQNKKYRIRFTGRNADAASNPQGQWTHLTSATSCVELQQKAAE